MHVQYPAAALNTEQLDEQIKEVMTVSRPYMLVLYMYIHACNDIQEVIPLLKEHMTSSCSTELLQQIKQLVMSHILIQLKDQVQGCTHRIFVQFGNMLFMSV